MKPKPDTQYWIIFFCMEQTAALPSMIILKMLQLYVDFNEYIFVHCCAFFLLSILCLLYFSSCTLPLQGH